MQPHYNLAWNPPPSPQVAQKSPKWPTLSEGATFSRQMVFFTRKWLKMCQIRLSTNFWVTNGSPSHSPSHFACTHVQGAKMRETATETANRPFLQGLAVNFHLVVSLYVPVGDPEKNAGGHCTLHDVTYMEFFHLYKQHFFFLSFIFKMKIYRTKV